MELKDVEEFRSLIIELDLPRQMDVLFGIKCPVCGKSDRICLLEPPDEMAGNIEHSARYRELWSMFSVDREKLAVCKFCGYLISIEGSGRRVELLLG